jgi:hypothetical protein
MSDEHKDEEIEVEGHVRSGHVTDEPAPEGEDENDVEAHVRKANVRMDSPHHI